MLASVRAESGEICYTQKLPAMSQYGANVAMLGILSNAFVVVNCLPLERAEPEPSGRFLLVKEYLQRNWNLLEKDGHKRIRKNIREVRRRLRKLERKLLSNIQHVYYTGFICPPLFLRYLNSCYFFDTTPKIMADVQSSCRKRGASLAELKSGEEENQIRRIIQQNYDDQRGFFIGTQQQERKKQERKGPRKGCDEEDPATSPILFDMRCTQLAKDCNWRRTSCYCSESRASVCKINL